MKLREDRHYLMRNGMVAGPLSRQSDNGSFAFTGRFENGLASWKENGCYWESETIDPYDLIEEVHADGSRIGKDSDIHIPSPQPSARSRREALAERIFLSSLHLVDEKFFSAQPKRCFEAADIFLNYCEKERSEK